MHHQLKDLMSRDVKVVSPDMTIEEAAREMSDGGFGMLPVGENDRMIGAISDRDIAVRGVAKGKGPQARVREVMTKDVKYCFDDQEVEEVTHNMADIQISHARSLPRP